MEKTINFTGTDVREFVKKYLGFSYVDDVDDLRSDLRLDEEKIEELVEACNERFNANVKLSGLCKIKQLVKRVRKTAK